jgi:hypothetical protein
MRLAYATVSTKPKPIDLDSGPREISNRPLTSPDFGRLTDRPPFLKIRVAANGDTSSVSHFAGRAEKSSQCSRSSERG